MKSALIKTSVNWMALVALFLFFSVAGAWAADVQIKKGVKELDTTIKAPAAKKLQTKRPIIQCEGPDPAVTSLRVMQGANGLLTIKVSVKNMGTEDFSSPSNQAALMIQLQNTGISGPSAYETLLNSTLHTLLKGQTKTYGKTHSLTGFIQWDHRTANSGECQATYKVIAFLSYDPDIRMDGNKSNDDCNLKNNKKTKPVKCMVECPW